MVVTHERQRSPDIAPPATGADRQLVARWHPTNRRRPWSRRVIVGIRGLAALLALVTGGAGLVNSAAGSADLDLGVRQTLSTALATQRFTTALVAVAVCAVVPGLWRGKRWAALASVGLGVFLFVLVSASARPTIGGAVVALGLVMVVGRSAFAVRSDPLRVAATLRRCAMAELVVLMYGSVGLFVLEKEFTTTTPITRSVSDGFRLLFLLPAATVARPGSLGAHFIESVRLLSLAVLAVTVVSLLVPVVRKPSGVGHTEAQRIAEAWGTNRLTHFTLWDDKHYAFASSGGAMVSYHPHHRVAMALGGPVGDPADLAAAIAAFETECDRNGWIPAFHQVGEPDRAALEAAGYQLEQIGSEAIVDVQGFSLEGSHWKKIRSSLSMLHRDGIRIEELAHPIDVATMGELEAVSQAWLASSGHRERTFTLGQFSATYLEQTRVLVARRGDGRIEAFVNIVPLYASSVGTFDLMRRRPDSANGVMDGLFVAMIERFRDEGLTGMNLGMAPLAQVPDAGLVGKSLNELRVRGDQWFNFQGLEAFKEKWRPAWEPRFLAYRTVAELPAVLRCVQTIGEIDPETRPFEWVRTIVGRFPVTLSIAGLALWLMAATAIDPAFHEQVLVRFGLSVPDVIDLDIWRPIASALVQADPGLVLGNAIMLVTLLPAAEWLVGSRRTAIVFWLGHVLTLVPLLVMFQILGSLGDDGALSFASSPDAGSSAGLWALAGALVHRIPGRRWQFAALVAAVGFHGLFGIFDREPAALQHAVAVLIGFALIELMEHDQKHPHPGSALRERLSGRPAARS